MEGTKTKAGRPKRSKICKGQEPGFCFGMLYNHPFSYENNKIMDRKRTVFFYFSVLCAGASVLVLEIGGTRILMPFYGGTVFVWTSLISVALTFLAVGYVVGGRVADKFPSLSTLWTILLGAGFLIYAIPLYDEYVLLWSESFGLRIGPLVSSVVLFGVPLALLGMVAPFSARVRIYSIQTAGQTIGSLYALETIGGLVGALLSGFYLAPIFSPSSIMQGTGVLLVSLFIIWKILASKTKL